MNHPVFSLAAAGMLLALASEPARAAALSETASIAANVAIPNAPGKRLVSLIVNYPPGAKSAAHRHARSAFIHALSPSMMGWLCRWCVVSRSAGERRAFLQ